MNTSLHNLLQRPDIWRPRDRRSSGSSGASTGYGDLDRALHGGGWPRAALTELLVARPGIGELRLLAPLLSELKTQQLWQVWINPPFIPYAPALLQQGIDPALVLIVQGEARQQLWACEQALRSAACGAVLFWPAASLRYTELRKLQVAAAAQHCSGFLLRDTRSAAQPSPAALRLQLHGDEHALQLDILKQRGGNSGQRISLPHGYTLQMQVPINQRAAVSTTIDPTEHSLPTTPAVAADKPLSVVTWQ